jgi:hypothetical protein
MSTKTDFTWEIKRSHLEWHYQWWILRDLKRSLLHAEEYCASSLCDGITGPGKATTEIKNLLAKLVHENSNHFFFIGQVRIFETYVYNCFQALNDYVGAPTKKFSDLPGGARRLILLNTTFFKNGLKIPRRMFIWLVMLNRNALLHTGGKIDKKYLESARKDNLPVRHRLGDEIEISDNYLEETEVALLEAACGITSAILSRFLNLKIDPPSVLEWALPHKMDHDLERDLG